VDKIVAWLQSEPAVVWTTGATALIAAVQNEPAINQDAKNWITLGLSFLVGLIIRQGVSPKAI
jgi:hypothetical protein